MDYVGYGVIGYAYVGAPAFIFLGILLFATGEMASAPRIQEYITWIAPKEKAGLYIGTNFLAMGLGGGLSGLVYTSLYGYFRGLNHPDYIWYTLAVHLVLGAVVISIYSNRVGKFKELDE